MQAAARQIEDRRLGADRWRSDVVLEIWLDDSGDPVTVELAGSLDQTTMWSLFTVVEQALAHGHRRFRLVVEQWEMLPPAIIDALAELLAGGDGRLVGISTGTRPRPGTPATWVSATAGRQRESAPVPP